MGSCDAHCRGKTKGALGPCEAFGEMQEVLSEGEEQYEEEEQFDEKEEQSVVALAGVPPFPPSFAKSSDPVDR